MEFPVLYSYHNLPVFFNTLRNSEIPSKFTYRYLANIGFSSSNEREFIPFLKALELIDMSGRPLQAYSSIKDKKEFSLVLAAKIRKAYKDLYELDANANSVSEDVLLGFFGKLTGSSQEKSLLYTNTFLALCSLADFEVGESSNQEVLKREPSPSGINPNINLNIELPTTTDEKVYESLFKHLRDLINP